MILTTALVFGVTASAQQERRIQLGQQVELAALLDLLATEQNLSIDYDESALRGQLHILLNQSVDVDQLDEIVNHILAKRGLTTIQTEIESALSVVKLPEAVSAAPIEQDIDTASAAGFRKTIVEITHRSVEEAAAIARSLASKSGSHIEVLQGSSELLIADVSPRLRQIVDVLRVWDNAGSAPDLRTIRPQFRAPRDLATLVTSIVASRDGMTNRKLDGKLLPMPDGSSLVLIAPPTEHDTWLKLIADLDVAETIERRVYEPLHHSVTNVAELLTQTCKRDAPQGSGDQWKIVQDQLTGTLIVTATPAEHQQIVELIERLNASPSESRRPLRAFPIRNRGVNEILDILEQLVERGALEDSGSFAVGQDDERNSFDPTRTQQNSSQNSPRPKNTQREPQTTPSDQIRRRSLNQPLNDRRDLELTADEGTNTLIAIGEPRLLEQLGYLIAQLDKRQPQVKVEVLVVGLTDADTLDLGVELQKLEVSGNTLISLASLFGLSSGSLASGTVSSSGTGFSGVVLNPGDFSVVVRALQTINDGRTVNMPHLLVNNNQSGTLNSVLQEPFTSTNASDTVATTSFAGTQDAGTTVTVRPQIAEGDHLVLEYAVAISNFVGESSTPGIPPARQQNSLQSVVTIPDGYTIAVGGIEVVTDADSVSQVPLLGDIPGVGEFFKNRSNTRSRSRFYVFIRSTVLRHSGFEDLKYLSDIDVAQAGIDDGWPVVQPRLIR